MKQLLLLLFTMFTMFPSSVFTGSLMLRQAYNETLGFYKCMKKKGYDDLLILYNPQSSGPGSLADIMSANSEGLYVQIVTAVTRKDNPDYIARNYRAQLGKNTVIRLWLYLQIQSSQKQYNWDGYDPLTNCIYLQSLIKSFNQYGFSLNIYTDRKTWEVVFGSQNGCPQINGSLLFWIALNGEDKGQKDFTYYRKFGGWELPYAKMLKYSFVCGEYMTENYVR